MKYNSNLLCIYVFVLQLSFSPTTPMSSHIRVLTLLVAMLLSCCGLAVVCGVIGYTHGMHTLAFMAAEVRLLSYGVVSALLFTPQLGLCDISWLVVGFHLFPRSSSSKDAYQPLSCFKIVARCAFFLCSKFKPTNTLCLKKGTRR